MRRHVFYLASHISKYRAITTRQLLTSCETFCGHTVVYRNLTELKNIGLIQRVSHERLPKYGYLARPELDACLHLSASAMGRSTRLFDVGHAFEVTETLMEMARYSFVKSIAHEFELTHEAIRQFSGKRRPDGIVQIERGQWIYEVSVEVETSWKSAEEIRKLLLLYREIVETPHCLCTGVVFVLGPRSNREAYLEQVLEFPEELKSRVLIVRPEELFHLKSEIFGTRSERYGIECGNKCQKLRVLSTEGPKYLQINSTNADFQWAFYPS